MEETNLQPTAKSPIYLLGAAAVLLGLMFDYLFFEKSFGVSVFIFEAAAVALTLWFSARFHRSTRSTLWLLALVLFFAAMVAVRANLFLTFLNIVASAGLVLLATKEMLKKHIVAFRIPDYFFTVVITPFKILRRSLQALSFLTTPAQKSSTVVFRRVVIGIVLALPFLLIFGALFASADLAFKQLIDSIFRFQAPDELVAHIIFIVGTSVVALGLFAYIFNIPAETKLSETKVVDAKPEKTVVDRTIEVKVFLWLIAGLFAIFLVFQVAYLFGGAINISQGSFTYAEYARKGFWELLVVALFTLIILLIMDKFTTLSKARSAWFTLPSLVLSTEIFIIIISASKRLKLYVDAYGLTVERLYAGGFIVFLGAIFIILAIKLWSKKEESFFAFGALLSMMAFLVFFNILNPDSFIAKRNIDRFNETGKIDATYLGSMSADAVPAMVGVYDRLTEEDKVILKEALDAKKIHLEKQNSHWQSFNFSRRKALEEINRK